MHRNTLFVGCAGYFAFSKGLIVEYLDANLGWLRAVIIDVIIDPTDCLLTTYVLVVDDDYEYDEDDIDNVELLETMYRFEKMVPLSHVRSLKVNDALEYHKDNIKNMISGAGGALDPALAFITGSTNEPVPKQVPESKTIKAAPLKLYQDACCDLFDSTVSTFHPVDNARWAYSSAKSVAGTGATVAGDLGTVAVTNVVPAWLIKKVSRDQLEEGPKDSSEEPGEPTLQHMPTIFVWNLADVAKQRKAAAPSEEPSDEPYFEAKPLYSLTAHQGGVSGLAVEKGCLYSSSLDKTVCMWNITSIAKEQPFLVARITGFGGGLHSLIIEGNDRLMVGTSMYNIEERMLPTEMPTERLVENNVHLDPDTYQFELQEMDDHLNMYVDNKATVEVGLYKQHDWKVYEIDEIFEPEHTANVKSLLSASSDFFYYSFTLALDMYHRCVTCRIAAYVAFSI